MSSLSITTFYAALGFIDDSGPTVSVIGGLLLYLLPVQLDQRSCWRWAVLLTLELVALSLMVRPISWLILATPFGAVAFWSLLMGGDRLRGYLTARWRQPLWRMGPGERFHALLRLYPLALLRLYLRPGRRPSVAPPRRTPALCQVSLGIAMAMMVAALGTEIWGLGLIAVIALVTGLAVPVMKYQRWHRFMVLRESGKIRHLQKMSQDYLSAHPWNKFLDGEPR